MLNTYTLRAPRWTPLALAISAALAGQAAHAQSAAPAAAASAAPAKAQTNQLDTVVVTGIRRSIQSANDRKKNASTVQDSLVAEDIDQFPDKNVGEALSRVTGVQLSRDFGEGTQVSIRGVEPDLNRIQINGMTALNSNGGTGRGADLRELPAEMIQSIDVVKGVTANMTEGGIGGTVDIITRKPLDFTKRTVSVQLSGESGSLRGGVQPRGSILVADKFLDGKLGVMGMLVYDNVLTRGDFVRNTSWAFLRDWDFSDEKTLTSLNPAAAAITSRTGCSALAGNATNLADCNRQWFDYSPRISRYGIWTRDHKRTSIDVTAQYKFTKDFDAYVSHKVNTGDSMLNDRNFGTDFSAATRLSAPGNAPTYNATGVPSGGTCTGVSGSATPAGMVVENHHVTQFTVGNCLNVAGQGGQGAFGTSARDFAQDSESKYTDLGFKYRNNAWRVEGQLVDSQADYSNETNNISLTQNAPGLVVKLGADRLPQFTFPANYSPDNASSYVQAQLQYRPTATQHKERMGKLDLQYNFDHNFFQTLWFGGQAKENSARQFNGGGYLVQNNGSLSATDETVDINARTANVNQIINFDPLYTGTAQRPNVAQTYINSGFRESFVNGARMQEIVNAIRTKSPGTFMSGYGTSGLPSNWTAPSYTAAAASGIFDTSAFNHNYLYETPGSDGKTYPQIPAFYIKEKTQAAYARLDWGTELFGLPLDGNIGVRYAKTDVSSTGVQVDRICDPAVLNSCTPRVIANKVVTIDNSYNDVLPSLNAALQLVPNKLIVRGGWAKVMSRPALNLLAPNVTCTTGSGDTGRGGDGTDDCTAGNPDLKPYRATKYDLSLEYYPNRDTKLSLALFRTDIDTYVRAGIYQPGVNFYGDSRLFDVTQPINGQGAKTQGIELDGNQALSFLPGWLSGFGVNANYTRMTYSYAAGNQLVSALDGSELPYPGLSKNAYNVGLWYDNDVINARIAYHHRDKYYTGGNDVSGNPNFRDKTGYLDAKLQWKATKNFTLSIEGKNLTDQAELSYAGDLSRPNELAWSGRRYYVTLGYKL